MDAQEAARKWVEATEIAQRLFERGVQGDVASMGFEWVQWLDSLPMTDERD